MTIRTCWCPDCEQVCTDHARVCTTCGAALIEQPRTTNTHTTSTNHGPSFRAMPDIHTFAGTTNHHNNDVRDVVNDVRRQVRDAQDIANRHRVVPTTGNGADALFGMLLSAARDNNTNNTTTNTTNDDWQAIPEALLDPGQASNPAERPTCPRVLRSLPRQTLHERSQPLFSVALTVTSSSSSTDDGTCRILSGVTGELGPLPTTNGNHQAISIQGPLWIPATKSQRTGQTPPSDDLQLPPNAVVVLERGDGISFVHKVVPYQQRGAAAIVMCYDQSASSSTIHPWPYCMKDSRTPAEQTAQPITIPVVMIRLEDGTLLLDKYASTTTTTASLTIARRNADSNACVVCTEPMDVVGQTLLTLTKYCGHAFHEACALQWLQAHPTCPYCRCELPSADEDPTTRPTRRRTEQDRSHDREAMYG